MSSNRELFIKNHAELYEYLDSCENEGVHYLTDDTEKGTDYLAKLGKSMQKERSYDNLLFLIQITEFYKRFAKPPRDGSISVNNEESVDYQYGKEEKADGFANVIIEELAVYYKTYFIDKVAADHADLINIDYRDKMVLKEKYNKGTLTLMDFLPAVRTLKSFMDKDVLPRYKSSSLEAKTTHSTAVVQRSISTERLHRGGVLDSTVHFDNLDSHVNKIIVYLKQLAHQLEPHSTTLTSSHPKHETLIQDSEITIMLNGIWQTTWREFCKPIIYKSIERALLEPLQSSFEKINTSTQQILDKLSEDISPSIHGTLDLISKCFKQSLHDLKKIRFPDEKHEEQPPSPTKPETRTPTPTDTRTHTPNGTHISLSTLVHKGLNLFHRRHPTTDSNSSMKTSSSATEHSVSEQAASGKDRPPIHPPGKERPGHK